VLLVNKQGQTRLAKYTNASMTVDERRALEGEIVRRCLARSEKQVCSTNTSPRTPTPTLPTLWPAASTPVHACAPQCSFIEHRNYKVIYRRYASLFFLVGVDGEEVGMPLLLYL